MCFRGPGAYPVAQCFQKIVGESVLKPAFYLYSFIFILFLQGNTPPSGTCEGKGSGTTALTFALTSGFLSAFPAFQILSAAGYHVLSLDYRGKSLLWTLENLPGWIKVWYFPCRGFGESTGEPSEAGLTRDALYLYQWVKARRRGGLVCLWGHSLGTGSVSLQFSTSTPEAQVQELQTPKTSACLQGGNKRCSETSRAR